MIDAREQRLRHRQAYLAGIFLSPLFFTPDGCVPCCSRFVARWESTFEIVFHRQSCSPTFLFLQSSFLLFLRLYHKLLAIPSTRTCGVRRFFEIDISSPVDSTSPYRRRSRVLSSFFVASVWSSRPPKRRPLFLCLRDIDEFMFYSCSASVCDEPTVYLLSDGGQKRFT